MEGPHLSGWCPRTLLALCFTGYYRCYQSRGAIEVEDMDPIPGHDRPSDPWILCPQVRRGGYGRPEVSDLL